MDVNDSEALLHRLRIRETAERYFRHADTPDPVGVADCFTKNGVFRSATQTEMRLTGRAEIADGFDAFRRWGRTSHMLANMHLVLDGHSAKGSMLGVSFVAGAAREGDPIRVRGLRYLDTWVVEDGEWLLAERVHEALWQFEATQMHLRLPDIAG
ncbi:hypothetical protein Sphch_3262 [Sphingobium chlorophenolicum L-1]|uniref:SnoaL-like domain-containing protein n=1 Tax=Sphingobium chlorophenolicum L-1 TaxID=690566 RepID=F6F360_SPHCR|nr:nuclear transport factor 2 family protein [Sphingobium chlorophenolicum]AEG50872.1 hypothetical protein Sphch_3262 [Sphingobium chlorophenolicum L-1]